MTRTIRSWIRFLVIAILLASAFALLKARDTEEKLPPRANLASFPRSLGQWQGSDLQSSEELAKSLGPGEFVFRDYVNPGQHSIANLLIAYFPTQRAGDTIHSPKNCLPGSGWNPAESSRIWIDTKRGSEIQVNRIIVRKGTDQALVLYWYQAHGQVTPSEYGAKYFLVKDAIRMNRSDGALVRVTTFMLNGEGIQAAQQRAVSFTQLTLPILDDYIPR